MILVKKYIIDREELMYLARRWYSFIERPVELKHPNYQEIIDSEDAYKWQSWLVDIPP